MLDEKLSVIISIYNIDSYLDRCIGSVINQTYKNLEIILIDDGSTDQSGKMCDSYAAVDKRVVVCHKLNEGLVRARKTGLELSTGRYVAFIDGDDWIEPEMYARMMQEAIVTGADIVDAGIFLDNEDKNSSEIIKIRSDKIVYLDKKNRTEIIRNLILGNSECITKHYLWSKIYKKEIIDNSYKNVPDGIDQSEDVLNFIWLVAIANSIFVVSTPYYHHILRVNSMSSFLDTHNMVLACKQLINCREVLINKYQDLEVEIIDKFVMRIIISDLVRGNSDIREYIRIFGFPSVNRLKNKRVIIYGAGEVGNDYIRQLALFENFEVVNWVDRNYTRYQYGHRRVNSIDKIINCNFDYIIVAVKKKELADSIKQDLVKKGVLEEKIIWEEPTTIYDLMNENPNPLDF